MGNMNYLHNSFVKYINSFLYSTNNIHTASIGVIIIATYSPSNYLSYAHFYTNKKHPKWMLFLLFYIDTIYLLLINQNNSRTRNNYSGHFYLFKFHHCNRYNPFSFHQFLTQDISRYRFHRPTSFSFYTKL